MYVCSDTDGLYSIEAIDASGNKYLVNNGTNLKFTTDKPVVANNKVYAITQDPVSGNKKLAIIHSPTNVEVMDITGEGNDDNVSYLTAVNNKLFFFAGASGNNDRYVYTMRTDVVSPELLQGKIIYESAEVTSVATIEDGIVYATWTESFSSGSVTVYEGYTGTAYQLVMSDQSFGWPEVSHITTNGNDIYLSVENRDASDNVVSTEIYKATHILPQSTKPNPVPLTTYYRGNFIFNITDADTSDPIQGVNVTIVNPLEEFMTTSNASGQGMFAWKPCEYYKFRLEAEGYQTIEYDQWATIWIPNVNFSSYAERDVQMIPDAATAIGDNEIQNLQLFPNPVNDILLIRSESAIVSLELYALTGTKVKQESGSQINSVDLSLLASGIYILVLTDDNGNQTITKITKQ